MLIYLATNKVNGKGYVGQTTKTMGIRRTQHFNDAFRKDRNNKIPFYNAVRKYGKESFEWKVLEKCKSIEDLNTKEQFWIYKLNTLRPNGYNTNTGGIRPSYCEETRKKISKKAKERNMVSERNPFYGKTHTEKVKKLIGLKNSNPSINTRKKMSAAHRGSNNWCAKLTEKQVLEIYCLYGCGATHKQIGDFFDIPKRQVSLILNGKKWKYLYDRHNIKDREWSIDKTDLNNSEVINLACRGEKASKAKLTEKEVLEIYDLFFIKNYKKKDLVKLYNMSRGAINCIVTGRSWKYFYNEYANN